jgi:coenzyme PQQ precursor peptide PqqA
LPTISGQIYVGIIPKIPRRKIMKKWRTPRIREIATGMEINSYACATL